MSNAITNTATVSVGRLHPNQTLFLLCDVQEKFRSITPYIDAIITNTQKLLAAGKAFDIPLLVTEQYPDRMGPTASGLAIRHAHSVVGKLTFSMCTPAVVRHIRELFPGDGGRRLQSVVLFGLEAHICVEQTAMDLREMGLDVHVVADCTVSRMADDRRLAFDRLRQIGCYVTTSENVIFKLLRTKEHPSFEVVRKLVARTSVETGLAKL